MSKKSAYFPRNNNITKPFKSLEKVEIHSDNSYFFSFTVFKDCSTHYGRVFKRETSAWLPCVLFPTNRSPIYLYTRMHSYTLYSTASCRPSTWKHENTRFPCDAYTKYIQISHSVSTVENLTVKLYTRMYAFSLLFNRSHCPLFHRVEVVLK